MTEREMIVYDEPIVTTWRKLLQAGALENNICLHCKPGEQMARVESYEVNEPLVIVRLGFNRLAFDLDDRVAVVWSFVKLESTEPYDESEFAGSFGIKASVLEGAQDRISELLAMVHVASENQKMAVLLEPFLREKWDTVKFVMQQAGLK